MDPATRNTNNLEHLVYDKDAPIATPSTPMQMRPIQAVSTIVPVLDRTVYNEAEETQDSGRTLEYVRVQLQALQYLASWPSDLLSGQQACEWTQTVSPCNFKPTAQEALRLCYYLRSQGFDTYAKFKHGYMNLYVADQESNKRGPHVDVLYWKQDFRTNEIKYQRSARTPGPMVVGGRRNAVTTLSPHTAEDRSLYTHFYSNHDEQQRQEAQRTLNSLATLASAAEIRLQNLVVSEDPDLGEIEVTLIQLEEYLALMRGE